MSFCRKLSVFQVSLVIQVARRVLAVLMLLMSSRRGKESLEQSHKMMVISPSYRTFRFTFIPQDVVSV